MYQAGHGTALVVRDGLFLAEAILMSLKASYVNRPWGWLRMFLSAISLPVRPPRTRAFLSTKLIQASDRFFHRLPFQSDQYDGKFFFAVGGVLGFTLLVYWSLTDYWDVKWFAGEDGASEWWSVVTYLASASMAAVTARLLIQLGHPRLGAVHALFAVALLVAAMEEISWGQRLFGWSTPEALASINEQDETTLHNLPSFNRVFPTIFFWGSSLALLGAVARAILHGQRRVTTADFILPSLVLCPALLMIMFWIAGNQPVPGNLPRILLTHFDLKTDGSEIPEVLLGLCLCLYTYGNLKRAGALRRRKITEQVAPQGRMSLVLPRHRERNEGEKDA